MANEQAIAEWQDILSRMFRGPTDIIGERLCAVHAAERECSLATRDNTHGFTVLMDCFQDFYTQTFDEMVVHSRVKNVNVCSILVASFQRMRCSLLGLYHGYPYDGAAGIRALFENAFFLGAVLNGYVHHGDWYSFLNGADVTPENIDALVRAKRSNDTKTDRKVLQKMRRSESGLSPEDQQGIDQLLQPLNSHVHRAESTIMVVSLDLMQTRSPPSLSPRFDLSRASHFTTPMVYAAWLLLRVLPFVSHPNDFSDDWKTKFATLDDSFQFYIRTTRGSGFEGFCRMVETRFTFDADSAWANVEVEPTQRGSESGIS